MKRSAHADMSEAERKALATRIRIAAEACGTRRDAAMAAGLSLSQLSLCALGHCAPSLVPMARLAAASGYTLDWIATGHGPSRHSDKRDRCRLSLDALNTLRELAPVIGAGIDVDLDLEVDEDGVAHLGPIARAIAAGFRAGQEHAAR